MRKQQKMRKRVAHEQALWYEEELQKESAKDRESHGKKPLKDFYGSEGFSCWF